MRTKKQNYERELPPGYKQVYYINAKAAKFGIIFNIIALVAMIFVMVIAVVALRIGGTQLQEIIEMEYSQLLLACLVLLVAMTGYIVLHELVHGVVYKARTGEKLTFGLSWSCAFCGVPHIFTYRKTAIMSVIAPFAVFTLLLIPTIVLLYFVNPLYYLVAAFIFGLHLGGCSGDLYVLYLLVAKFKDKKTLMRDTGPEQFFYEPDEDTI